MIWGFHLVVLVRGWGMEGKGPWTAIVAGLGAHGELGAGEDRERRGLGELEDSVEALTVEPIGMWWPDIGDRRGRPVFVWSSRRRN